MSTNANFSLIQESSNPDSNQSSGYKFKIFTFFNKKSKKDKTKQKNNKLPSSQETT